MTSQSIHPNFVIYFARMLSLTVSMGTKPGKKFPKYKVYHVTTYSAIFASFLDSFEIAKRLLYRIYPHSSVHISLFFCFFYFFQFVAMLAEANSSRLISLTFVICMFFGHTRIFLEEVRLLHKWRKKTRMVCVLPSSQYFALKHTHTKATRPHVSFFSFEACVG